MVNIQKKCCPIIMSKTINEIIKKSEKENIKDVIKKLK